MKSRFLGYGLAALSGCLLVLATPMMGHSQLVTVGLMLFFVGYFSLETLRSRMIATFIMALPYCAASAEPMFRLAGTWWIGEHQSQWFNMGNMYLVGVGAMIIFGALIYFFPVWVSMRRLRRLPVALVIGIGFGVVEFIRSTVFGGYSWGAFGYLLVDTQYVKHFGALVGVYGLTAYLVMWSAWFGQAVVRIQSGSGTYVHRFRQALLGSNVFYETVGFFVLFALVLFFGAYRESRTPDLGLNLRVAVIASQIHTDESIHEGSYRVYRALLREALESNPDLILTPENVFPYFILDEEKMALVDRPVVYLANANELYQDFLALTRSASETTFAVAMHSQLEKKYFNSIVLYQDGVAKSIYHKRRPVPFTEYVPFGLDIHLFQQFARGDEVQDFRLGDMVLGGYICSEIDVTPLSVRGAKLILSPSNDSALVSDTINLLHHQVARMRAIESGAYMVRASKGGISGVIDPYGRTLGSLKDKTGVLVVDIN